MAIETLQPQAPADEDLVHGASPLTVIYDSDCGVCGETVRRLRRWDHEGRFEFMPLRVAASCGRPRLEQLAAAGHLGDAVHVVDEATGRVVSGGHAALAILDALPGGWLLRPWAVLPPTAAAVVVNAALVLMGKHCPDYSPHLDHREGVIVLNADKVRLTGRKLDQKFYRQYSGYPGGLRETSARDVLAQKPEKLIREAIKGMLPKTRMGARLATRVRVYTGATHPHAAQTPEPLSLAGK